MEILWILLLVLLNGVLAMSEIAVFSSRSARLSARADAGDKGAQAALALIDSPDRFLSTVQIGITLVGILAGAFGGATVGRQLGEWYARVLPFTAPYSQSLGVGSVVIFTTYLSLVLGELVPKRVGLQYAEQIASAIALPMRGLSTLAAPLVWLLSRSTNLILWLLQIRPSDEADISDGEIIQMVKDGSDDGVFDQLEVQMVRGVLTLDDRPITSMMTPRTELIGLDLDDPQEEQLARIAQDPFAYYPAYRDGIDNIVGLLRTRDLLPRLVRGEPINLEDHLLEPIFVPESLPASRLLTLFKQEGVHMAVVLDEFGGIEGIVTLNDVLTEIVGNIEPEEPAIVQREDGSWLVDGITLLERLFDLFGEHTFYPDDDERYGYITLAGFVMSQFDRLPKIADHFIIGEWRFEIVDMDGRQIDRVLISHAAPPAPQEGKI